LQPIYANRPEFHDPHTSYPIFGWITGLQPLVFMILSTAIYLILLYLYEVWWKKRQKQKESEIKLTDYAISYSKPDDVIEEEKLTNGTDPEDVAVYAYHISKGYKAKNNQTKYAVYDASFTVSPGEIFCLLGPTRCGKSSVLRCLTNFARINQGEIYILGKQLESDFPEKIGYCPQVNALADHLTVLDHLEIYSLMKGIPEKQRKQSIEEIILCLDLDEYRNIKTVKLSDGNKRKLMVGIALLGDPHVLFFDEPTTATDPQTRQNIWSILQFAAMVKGKKAIVIATHSLEEVEALASKLAIIVNGSFRCIGNPYDIKKRTAIGYFIDIKFEEPTNEISQQFIDNLGITLKLGIILQNLMKK